MAYIGFVGAGHVGNFQSTITLELIYPAQRNAGRKATVETAGVVAWYFSTGAAWVVITSVVYPVPSNNIIAFFGDSRSAAGSYDTSTKRMNRLQPNGWIPWALARCNHRVDAQDCYAVSGQDLYYNRDEMTSVPGVFSNVTKGYALTGVTGGPGTAVGATTDTAGYANGLVAGSAIGIAAAGTGSIKIGDIVTIGSSTYQIATGVADVSAGGSITLTSALRATIAASAVAVTISTPAITSAGAVMVLAGVNGINGVHTGGGGEAHPWVNGNTNTVDGGGAMAGTSAFYTEILNGIDAANKITFLCNEIPNTNNNGAGAAQLARRTGLDNITTPSSKVVKLNTWDQMSDVPGSNVFKAGYAKAGENVHPNIRGARALGEYIGDIWNTVYASFPVRNAVPTSAAQAGYMYSSIMGGAPTTGTNITGNVANGMTATRPANAGLTCDASLVDLGGGAFEQVFHVYGTGSASAGTIQLLSFGRQSGTILNSGSAASPIALNGINAVDGDKVYAISGITIDAGNIGLVAAGPSVTAQSSTVVFNDTGAASINPATAFTYSEDYAGLAYQSNMLSPPVTLPVGWSTGGATARLYTVIDAIYYYGDRAIDFTVRISSLGLVRNR